MRALVKLPPTAMPRSGCPGAGRALRHPTPRDSAPHPTTAKYGPKAKAGVFNAAYGLEVVADVFNAHDALDQLGAFASNNGCAIYGVEEPTASLELTREAVDAELATELSTSEGDSVVLFGTEEASRWSVRTV